MACATFSAPITLVTFSRSPSSEKASGGLRKQPSKTPRNPRRCWHCGASDTAAGSLARPAEGGDHPPDRQNGRQLPPIEPANDFYCPKRAGGAGCRRRALGCRGLGARALGRGEKKPPGWAARSSAGRWLATRRAAARRRCGRCCSAACCRPGCRRRRR